MYFKEMQKIYFQLFDSFYHLCKVVHLLGLFGVHYSMFVRVVN